MKKRTVISIIITIICVILTNKFWFNIKPLQISFNAIGTGITKFEFFLNKAMINQNGNERKALLGRNVSWDYIQKELTDLKERLDRIGKDDKKLRDAYKKWFSKISVSKRTELLAAWVEVHAEEVMGFADKYLKALSAAKKRLND